MQIDTLKIIFQASLVSIGAFTASFLLYSLACEFSMNKKMAVIGLLFSTLVTVVALLIFGIATIEKIQGVA